MSYRRPMWCGDCQEVTDHSVMKRTVRMENGKQLVHISKICTECETEKASEISAKSWVALVKKNYWGGD